MSCIKCLQNGCSDLVRRSDMFLPVYSLIHDVMLWNLFTKTEFFVSRRILDCIDHKALTRHGWEIRRGLTLWGVSTAFDQEEAQNVSVQQEKSSEPQLLLQIINCLCRTQGGNYYNYQINGQSGVVSDDGSLLGTAASAETVQTMNEKLNLVGQ